MAHMALSFGLCNAAVGNCVLEQRFLSEMMYVVFTNPSAQQEFEELKRIVMEYLTSPAETVQETYQ